MQEANHALHQNRQHHSSKKAQLQVLQVSLNLLTSRMRQNLKNDTGRVSKGSGDPIKSHNVFDVLSEEGMEAETTPVSPRKGQLARLSIT